MNVRADDIRWTDVRVDCDLCGPGPTRVLGYRGGASHRAGLGLRSRIVQCVSCGLIFPSPMPHPVERRDAAYGDVQRYFARHDFDEKVEGYVRNLSEAEAHLGARGRMLDVGCGRGEALVAAARSGWSATGVEMSSAFASEARTRAVSVREGTLEECAFPPASFDYVILGAVLEHVYDPRELLREIRRVLRSKGLLFVEVPNEEGLYFRVGNAYQRVRGRDWVLNLSPTFEPFHVHGFSPRSLRRALELGGFRLVRLKTGALSGETLPPGHEAVLARVVDRLGGVLGMGAHLEAWAEAI